MKENRLLRPPKLQTLLMTSALGVAGALAGCHSVVSSEVSTAVYYNGKVYTADRENPSATAFVVRDGKFIYVGDDRGALEYGRGVDLAGKRVIPGIVDSHCHPVLTSALIALEPITVPPEADLAETLACLKEKANDADHRGLPFVLGFGFGTNCRPVRAVDLDRIIPDRPAVIFSSDGHALWINSKAMKLAKLTRDTPDPVPGGSYFERDERGNPTGFVVETTASFNLLRELGIFSPEYIRMGLKEVLALFAQNGVTTVFEAGFGAIREQVGLQALREMERNGELTMRFFTSYFYFGPPMDTPENMLEVMMENRREFTSELIHADTLKIIGDGTLEVQTAWMAEDYLPPAEGHGGALIRLKDMLPAGKLATGHGFNVHNHAIGDAAIAEALDFYEALGGIEGTKTICHVQVLPADGVRRFIEQDDVFYQTTPCWLIHDQYTEEVLGRERYLRQVPLASLLKGGVTLTFGSDFPASDGPVGVNPFFNMWVAVNRRTDETIAPPNSEGIEVGDCIDAYTINGARQLGAADRIGSVSVGKSADFVICSDDLLAIDPQRLKEVSVEQTYFQGKCVYERENFPAAKQTF